MRGRWCLICRNGVCARCPRIRQTPFSFCVLRPHNPGTNQRNFLDHQPPRKERKETKAQPECSCLQEIFRPDRYGLRNRDAAKFKSAPGSDAHAANFERNAEAATQFLLNLSLCPLRLHIQVHAEQNHRTESNQCSQSDQYQPAQFLHPQTLRSPSLKQRPKALTTFRVTDIVIILNPTAGNRETVRDWQERVESIVGGWPIRITSHAV